MASKKYYAYYLKGNKIAIVQKNYNLGHCSLAGYNNQTDCEAASGTWYSAGSSAGDSEDHGKYKSPLESVADGLELEYAYSPIYNIQTTNDVDQNITQYQSTDGKLSIADNTSAYINYATTYALAADKYIVLKKAGKFNGLHKIQALSNNTGTNNKITLTTKYTGSEAAWTNFEETPELYYAVDVMEDESFELDINRYQANAIVYYVKAKLAEDAAELELKEYFMREFKKMVEKFHTGREYGPKRIQPFGHFNLK